MRFFPTLLARLPLPLSLVLVLVVVLVPALSQAQDAGSEPDSGLDDAGSAPDANPADETSERCLDGYDRSYVEACAGKEPGAGCTFPGGESGQCAALRCLDPGGQAICVATKGQPAPPPNLGDAGLAEPGTELPADSSPIEGGGCAMGAQSAGSASPWGAALVLAWVLARRRGR